MDMSFDQLDFAQKQGNRTPLPGGFSGGGLPTRQRRPAMIAVAVLLVAAGAFGGLQLFGSSNHKTSVLVLVRSVPAGHAILSTDLASTDLSGRVAYTPAASEAAVVGQTAARDLFAGQLLTHSMLAMATVPDVSHALVGLQLKAGQVPSAGIADSDTVELMDVPSANNDAITSTAAGGSASAGQAAAAATSLLLATGTVFAFTVDPNSAGGALVTVLVPRAEAQALSVAASAGQVSLIRVGS
jgi:hypothetical protein